MPGGWGDGISPGCQEECGPGDWESFHLSPHTKHIFLSLAFLREDFSQGIIYLRKQKDFRNMYCVTTYWDISICISYSVTFGSNVDVQGFTHCGTLWLWTWIKQLEKLVSSCIQGEAVWEGVLGI